MAVFRIGSLFKMIQNSENSSLGPTDRVRRNATRKVLKRRWAILGAQTTWWTIFMVKTTWWTIFMVKTTWRGILWLKCYSSQNITSRLMVILNAMQIVSIKLLKIWRFCFSKKSPAGILKCLGGKKKCFQVRLGTSEL